ncbi:hypothetical protein MTR_2g055540 [Medicago truncatula]|uniref:Uncharacterized protein n=1 Tax=Medicago truncatula TaxID=3880 RepID=A0A072V8P1_MEDTR|nr:hypothetical protein MTR_2g055540 [Medicago truncatula]
MASSPYVELAIVSRLARLVLNMMLFMIDELLYESLLRVIMESGRKGYPLADFL